MGDHQIPKKGMEIPCLEPPKVALYQAKKKNSEEVDGFACRRVRAVRPGLKKRERDSEVILYHVDCKVIFLN